MLPPACHKHTCSFPSHCISGLREGEKKYKLWHYSKPETMLYNVYSYGGLCFSDIPQPLPGVQTPTRTPVIDVQMDVVPKVSPNLGQTSVQDRDQWLPWPVTKPGRQEGKASKLQLEITTLPGHRCAQIHSQTDNNGACFLVSFFFFFFPGSRGNSFSLCVTNDV